uniref:Clan AA aspartic protease, AF_0612 family n=2 Tax=unclassified Candidatus Kentrum TaxID=2643149 RepID=A0A451AD50_9GAMM|nr:MAG: hypothetical protein BECKLPF1236B_GA0070989_11226 [Candidatus Kentron sp. LPFa]VFK63904.1 MAG: hypothetical protein BECKUNK1418G_GA0071005_103921 [Candidatus Kentron sp. UNK]VFK70748.1 MAG: hypothetical protein BECKUNK1418H_GA0071006_103721 [Candidatus Kentron sp. UNK]
MGQVVVNITLENYLDRVLSQENRLAAEAVRAHETSALVDSGAVMLALPRDVTEKLGLRPVRKVIVTYADERREECEVVAPIYLTVAGRVMVTEAVTGPPLSEALVGQVILEELDLLVDCQRQILTPRPESPIYPSLKMKKAGEC